MKSSKTTVQQRVEEVLGLRLLGAEWVDIRRHASEAEWQIGDRQLQRYIAAGDAILADTLERDREKLLNRHVAQRRALYARAVAVSDHSTARQILRDEAELLNLYPPKRTEVSGKDGGPLEFRNLSDDELDSTIKDIENRLRDRRYGNAS